MFQSSLIWPQRGPTQLQSPLEHYGIDSGRSKNKHTHVVVVHVSLCVFPFNERYFCLFFLSEQKTTHTLTLLATLKMLYGKHFSQNKNQTFERGFGRVGQREVLPHLANTNSKLGNAHGQHFTFHETDYQQPAFPYYVILEHVRPFMKTDAFSSCAGHQHNLTVMEVNFNIHE